MVSMYLPQAYPKGNSNQVIASAIKRQKRKNMLNNTEIQKRKNNELRVDSMLCQSAEEMKSDNIRLSSKIVELKKQVVDLNEKLRLSEQEKGHAWERFIALTKTQKAGPLGSVKGSRTNPFVVPDETIN
ncbi:hypothetical protein OROGR_032873 [Orobanche gracilis]